MITLEEKAFKIDENNYAFGYYALPLKITSVSKYGIDPDADVTIYPGIHPTSGYGQNRVDDRGM